MSSRSRVLFLSIAVAIAIAAFVVDRGWSVTPFAAPSVARPVAPSTPLAPLPSVAAVTTVTADTTAPINPALVRGYATSTNYREFIAFARSDVAHGGGAYAIQAEADCDYVKAVLDAVHRGPKEALPDSRNIVARAEARTLLEARCGPLMQTEIGGRTFVEFKRSGADQRDPLLRLRDQLHDPRFRSDRGYRDSWVARIVDTQDPLMWTLYRSVLIPTAMSGDRAVEGTADTRTAWFDGVTYSGREERALAAAMELVPCALGVDCARLDTHVAVACLQYHVCEHDRFGLEKRKADAQGYDFLRVLALQDALVTAWKTRRVAAFVKP